MNTGNKNKLTSLLLAIFAVITFYLTTALIFDLFGVREGQGNYVEIVVWGNYISSLLYLASALGFLRNKVWTIQPLLLTLIVLIISSIGLSFHINDGGMYEAKTIGALALRFVVTLIFTYRAYRLYKNIGMIGK